MIKIWDSKSFNVKNVYPWRSGSEILFWHTVNCQFAGVCKIRFLKTFFLKNTSGQKAGVYEAYEGVLENIFPKNFHKISQEKIFHEVLCGKT